jgi:hypothetical protein
MAKPTCSNGCAKEAFCRGLCAACYQRARLAGAFTKAVRPEGRWAPIPGYEGYYDAADDGRIWSHPRTTTPGGLVNHRLDDRGYHMVTLSKQGKHTTIRVHLLVLLAFRGPCPPGKEGTHDDGDKDNNTLANLWWKTHGENISDQVLHGTHPWASKVHCPWGHDYSEENTRLYKNSRFCKTCDRTRSCRDPECTRPNHDHVNTPWPAGVAVRY